jgi:hypothetical protein
MLKENSGMPPPRISSNPGIPVESCLIFTLSWGVIAGFSIWFHIKGGQIWPDISHKALRKSIANEDVE